MILLVSSTVFASEPKRNQPITPQEKYNALQTVVHIPLSEQEIHPKIVVATTNYEICCLKASYDSSKSNTDVLKNSINYTIYKYNCIDQNYNTSMKYGMSSFTASAIKATTIDQWKKEPTIAHQLATFSDCTLIITTKEGHVTAIAPDKKISFINYDQNNKSHLITDDITALGCSTHSRCMLAVGSKNGTITIFDTSKEKIEERQSHSISFKNSTPVTSICFTPTDDIYFSTQHNIFFLPQNKNQNHKSIYETKSFIKCIAILENTIACLINTDNNYGICCITNQNQSSSIYHDLGTTPITSLCLHKASRQLYLITGNMNGDVTIRYLNNNNQLSEYVTLKHISPVDSVTITKDNSYLIIKTTQFDENGNIIGNTIMHYPTPASLDNQYSIYSLRLSDLNTFIVLNNNDGPKLYDTLIKHHNFIHTNTTNQKIIDCKANIMQAIILFIKNIKDNELITNPVLSILRIIQQFSNSKKISYPEINTALSDKIVSILLAAKKHNSTNNDILQEINKFIANNPLIPADKKKELINTTRTTPETANETNLQATGIKKRFINLCTYKKTILLCLVIPSLAFCLYFMKDLLI